MSLYTTFSICSDPTQLQVYVSNVFIRSNSTPYQWLPNSGRMTNTFDLSLYNNNETLYNIANASGIEEFTLWIDNRILPDILDIPSKVEFLSLIGRF